MANELGQNPWKLDTAGTIYLHRVKIITIIWVKPSTIAHALLITDLNDKTIVDAYAEAANQSQIFRLEPGWYNGMKLATLQSGTVLVHFM